MGKGLGTTQRAILTALRTHTYTELQKWITAHPGRQEVFLLPMLTAEVAKAVNRSPRQVLQAMESLEKRGLVKSSLSWSEWVPTKRRTAPGRDRIPLEIIDQGAVRRAVAAAEEQLQGWIPRYTDRWGEEHYPDKVRVTIQVWNERYGGGSVIERPVMSRVFSAVLPTGVRVEDIGPAWVGEFGD